MITDPQGRERIALSVDTDGECCFTMRDGAGNNLIRIGVDENGEHAVVRVTSAGSEVEAVIHADGSTGNPKGFAFFTVQAEDDGGVGIHAYGSGEAAMQINQSGESPITFTGNSLDGALRLKHLVIEDDKHNDRIVLSASHSDGDSWLAMYDGDGNARVSADVHGDGSHAAVSVMDDVNVCGSQMVVSRHDGKFDSCTYAFFDGTLQSLIGADEKGAYLEVLNGAGGTSVIGRKVVAK